MAVKPQPPQQPPKVAPEGGPIIQYVGEGAEKVQFVIHPHAVRYVVHAHGQVLEYLR